MEPLIRLRLLGSQLQTDEIQHVLKEITRIHGFDTIISFIFNYFLHEYNQTKQYHNNLLSITNIISTIIQSRENVKSSKKDLNKIIPITIDNLPSDLIGECSSYLCLNDYINFMKTNRIIYCASNSTVPLQKLDILSFNQSLDLTRFEMVKTLCISPAVYNKCKIAHFTHLNKLCVYNINGNKNDINMFINSNKINFSEITHLKLKNFGSLDIEYDFDEFCYLLTKFPNVTHLELEDIFLTEFNNNNSNIPKITPKLQVLICWDVSYNISANELRNKLMNMYSKQITELELDDEWACDIDTYSFARLKTLIVYSPRNESLKQIIESATDLRTLHIHIHNQQHEWKETIMDVIIKSFQKFANMNVVSFACDSIDIQHVVSFIEMGLINSKKINRKSLKVLVRIVDNENFKMREIELYTTRIMNALYSSNINDVMFIFRIPKDLDTSNYMDKICEHFRQTYLVKHLHESNDQRIIISNKNCKINGYQTRIEKLFFGMVVP